MANILVFGASTTYGAWDLEGGWIARLRKWIDEKNIKEKKYIDYSGISLIYNLGISDETTKDLIKRFKSDTEPRLWENNIFQKVIGTNYRNLLEDGLHGNAQGHELIFEEVRNYLSGTLIN